MNYRRLTPKDRYQIEAYLNSEMTGREIARRLSVHPSTISREIRRLAGVYNADQACGVARERSSSRRREKFLMTRAQVKYVRRLLREDWSPDQIVGRMRRRGRRSVSYQTIYRYVARMKLKGDDLWQRLRILKKERRERSLTNFRTMKNTRNDRVFIDARPSIVENRERIGDYERDTVFGLKNEVLLLTIVDRVSKKSWIRVIEKKCSALIHEATVEALKSETVHTITNDNGTEFAQHQKTAEALRTSVYFSRAYRSWERGTNENTNGLIRQYCPKKRSLAHLTAADAQWIEDRLNNRPRKSLGYRTPNEVHRSVA